MTDKATARPWSYAINDDIGVISRGGKAGPIAELFETNAEHDTRHIVHCVNNYDALYEIAERMADTGIRIEADLRLLNDNKGGPVADRINRFYESWEAFRQFQKEQGGEL